MFRAQLTVTSMLRRQAQRWKLSKNLATVLVAYDSATGGMDMDDAAIGLRGSRHTYELN